MADRELIAAILTAGTLPTVPRPEANDGEAMLRAIGHAIGPLPIRPRGARGRPIRGSAGTRCAAALAVNSTPVRRSRQWTGAGLKRSWAASGPPRRLSDTSRHSPATGAGPNDKRWDYLPADVGIKRPGYTACAHRNSSCTPIPYRSTSRHQRY